MIGGTKQTRRLLGAAIVLNLGAGLFGTYGILSSPLDIVKLLPEHPAAIAQADAAGLDSVTDATPAPITPVSALEQSVPMPGPSPAVPTTGAAARRTTTTGRPPAAPALGLLATIVPPKADVAQVKQELSRRVSGFKPTDNQIRQFSGQVCGVFAKGYSYAEVKTATLKAAARYPFLGVSPDDADFAIHEAVRLYCPQYGSRLP